jgi:hypothetical protein
MPDDKNKIELVDFTIKRWTGELIKIVKAENFKKAIEQAIKEKMDLSYADLRYADLSSADLSSADLRYADLSYADLSSANLRYANLSSANLSYADLSSARNLNKYLTTPLFILKEQTGTIRAYKLTTSGCVGPFQGGLKYEINKTYIVANANCDENIECGEGINVASLDWCLRNWQPNFRIFIVEFEASDIATIPIGSDGKFRLKKCRVVSELNLASIDWPPKIEEKQEK